MGWLSKLLAGTNDDDASLPGPRLDAEARRAQLIELDSALSQLIEAMSEPPSPLDNPGWRGLLRDYAWMRNEIRELTGGTITHDGVYDLILGVRPVFRAAAPAHLAFILPLQERVLAAVRALQTS